MNKIENSVIIKRKKLAYKVLIITCWTVMISSFLPFPTIIKYNDGTRTRPMLVLITRRATEAWGFLAVIRGDFSAGLTLGRYRIETKHGEIVIRSFSEVQAGDNRRLSIINLIASEAGRVTHNLEVNRVPLHNNLTFYFFHDSGMGVSWPDHETVISGVSLPVRVGSWGYGPWGSHPFSFEGDIIPKDITLTDSTRINFPLSFRVWRLVIYKDGTWFLREFGSAQGRTRYFLVKHPGKDEYKKYTSITFHQHWGNFISGEPFVEE